MTTATTAGHIKQDTLEFYQREHSEREKAKAYGTTGARNAGDQVFGIIRSLNRPLTVLDFGAGKGSLGKYVKTQCELWGCHVPEWTNYDPAIPGIDQLPDRQFDMVVSSDVLEHIEPDCIEAVIATLHKLAGKYQFHSIACDPAGLIMPDGRNAHLICERLDWWLEKFSHPEWVLMRSEDVVVRKRGTMRRHCTLQLDRV